MWNVCYMFLCEICVWNEMRSEMLKHVSWGIFELLLFRMCWVVWLNFVVLCYFCCQGFSDCKKTFATRCSPAVPVSANTATLPLRPLTRAPVAVTAAVVMLVPQVGPVRTRRPRRSTKFGSAKWTRSKRLKSRTANRPRDWITARSNLPIERHKKCTEEKVNPPQWRSEPGMFLISKKQCESGKGEVFLHHIFSLLLPVLHLGV